MTENEALNTLHILLAHEKAVDAGEIHAPNNLNSQEKEALQFILEEIQAHRAIGTVEEFKAIKKWKSDMIDEFCRYDANSCEELVTNTRNKAIDDFINAYMDWYESTYSRVADDERLEMIKIAEQLKGGVDHEHE